MAGDKYAALHEPDSKYAALHADSQPSEYGLAFQKAGAPDEAPEVPKDADRWQKLLEGARSLGVGVLRAAPFKDELGGVVEAADAKLRGDARPVSDLYREGRDAHREFWRGERERGGIPGYVGEFVGGIPSAIASSAIPLGLLGQGAVMGGISGLDASEDSSAAGIARDTAIGAGLGAGISAAAPYVTQAVMHPITTAKAVAGKVMQVPQIVTDALAERVGRSEAMRGLVGVADDVAGLPSAKVKALRLLANEKPPPVSIERPAQVISRAAPDELAIARATARDSDDWARVIANREAAPGIAAERAAIDQADDSAREAIELARIQAKQAEAAASMDPNKTNPLGAIRAPQSVARDVAPAKPMTPEIRNEAAMKSPMSPSRVKPLPRGADADKPEWWDLHFKPGAKDEARAFEDMADKAMGLERARMRQNWAENSEINGLPWVNPYAQTAEFQAAQAVSPETAIARTSVMEGDAKKDMLRRALRQFQRSPEGRAMKQAKIAAVNDEIAARGSPRVDFEAQLDTLFPERVAGRQAEADVARISAERQSAAARDRLQNIATGRKALAPFLGAFGGNAIGGVPGAVLGAMTGQKGITAMDFAGAVGQKLSESALKAAANPSGIQKLATQPGPLGDIVRKVMSGIDNPNAVAARAYMLALTPAFRSALAEQDSAADSAR